MNLNIYKVDLDTDQPNGGKGESPRSAFTKYNNSLDAISGELTTLDDSAIKKAANLSDLTDAGAARSNLGLGTAATMNVGVSNGQLMEVGAFGLGVVGYNHNLENKSYLANFWNNTLPTNYPKGEYQYGVMLSIAHGYSGSNMDMVFTHTDNSKILYRYSRLAPWREIYHSGSTTVDSNGFIKKASPIIKLFNNTIDKTEHLEIGEVELERVDVGHYVLRNTPLLSRDGWYIETPKDRNNNIYFYLDYEEDEDNKTLTIKTYEPDYSTGRAEAGAPMDIIDGRFVSLRFEEDPSLYPELEEPETEEE